MCDKKIKEINMPANIEKMFDVVNNSKPNQQLNLRFIVATF